MENNYCDQYNVVYETDYIAEGYIIYRQDYKKFIKIMRDYGNNFIIFANDEYEDEPNKMDYRPITIDVNKYYPLYESVKKLTLNLNGAALMAKGDLDLGKTHLVLQNLEGVCQMTVMKDIRHKKNNDYNCAIFQIQDTPNGDFNMFYNELEMLSSQKEREFVKQKMLDLIPTKRVEY